MSRFDRSQAFGGRKQEGGVSIGADALVTKSINTLLQQACSTGTLKLANRELRQLPPEMFSITQIQYAGKKWWEEQDLQAVDFSHNEIEELPAEFQAIIELLRQVNGSYNRLAEFPLRLTLACQQNLVKLDLSHNRLKTFLDIPWGRVNQLPVFSSLAEVDLSHNRLTTVDGFSNLCPELVHLDLSNNQLVAFEENAARVGTLDGLKLQPFDGLRSLKLSNNALERLPRRLMLECNSSLETIDLSWNRLSLLCDDGRPLLFGPSVTALNLKQNAIRSVVGEQFFCPKLKDLSLGNNQLQALPLDLFSRSHAIGFLDISNNKIVNIDAILQLEGLVRLDITNNDVSVLNPRLTYLSKLNSLVLDGNPLRSVRRDILNQGTVGLLKYLRTRLAPEDNQEEAPADDGVKSLALKSQAEIDQIRQDSHANWSPPRHGRLRHDDLPFATESNANVHHARSAVGLSDAEQRRREIQAATEGALSIVPEGEKLVHAGERNGTSWDLSLPEAKRGGSFAASRGRGQVRTTNPTLPPLIDVTLNFSTMHSHESAPFRGQVTRILLNNQPQVSTLDLSITAPFPVLKEVHGNGCVSLVDIHIDQEKIDNIPEGQLASLHSLMMARCGFTETLCPSLFGRFTPLGQSLTRLDFSSNGITSVPVQMHECCPCLRYINLSYNKISRFPSEILYMPNLIELQFAHNGVAALPPDDQGDREGYAARFWPALQLLDLSYNELETVPFTLGNLTQLRSIGLEGNRIKWLRSSTLAKGTHAVLEYLRDKIPQ